LVTPLLPPADSFTSYAAVPLWNSRRKISLWALSVASVLSRSSSQTTAT
jgi:hypothetical protein